MPTERQYAVLGPLPSGVETRAFLGCELSDGQPQPEQPVVVVWVPEDIAQDAKQIQRLQRETVFVTQLEHEHLITVHGLECFDEGWARVVDFCDGEPLSRFLDLAQESGEGIPLTVAGRLMLDLCDAVHYAHEAGRESSINRPLVHGAIRPTTLMLGFDGVIKVTGYGAGVLSGVKESDQTEDPLRYTAPEQIIGGKSSVSPTSDVYALGALLWQLLANQPPFGDVDDVETAVLGGKLKELELDGSAAKLLGVARKAMAKKGADRFDSVADLKAAIVEALEGQEVATRGETAAFANRSIPEDAPEREARATLIDEAQDIDALTLLSRPETTPEGVDASLHAASRPGTETGKIRVGDRRPSADPLTGDLALDEPTAETSAAPPGEPMDDEETRADSSSDGGERRSAPPREAATVIENAPERVAPDRDATVVERDATVRAQPPPPSVPAPAPDAAAEQTAVDPSSQAHRADNAPTNPPMDVSELHGGPMGATHPGQTLPGSVPPQSMAQPQAGPPGHMPPGAYPPGTYPSVPPPGYGPPGSMPPGQMPPHGSMPPGGMPPGSMPPGQMPPQGSMPPGSMPPYGSMPPGSIPPGGMPPRGSMPPGMRVSAPASGGGPRPSQAPMRNVPLKGNFMGDGNQIDQEQQRKSQPPPGSGHASAPPPGARPSGGPPPGAAGPRPSQDAFGQAGLQDPNKRPRAVSEITSFDKDVGQTSKAWLIGGIVLIGAVLILIMSMGKEPPKGLAEESERHALPKELVEAALKNTPEPTEGDEPEEPEIPEPELVPPSGQVDPKEVEPAEGEEEPKPVPKFGYLSLESQPNVDVYDGNDKLGRTPLRTRLKTGSYRLRFTDKDKLINRYKRYRIRPDGDHKDKLIFGEAQLTIEAPTGARIFLNGRPLGKAPLEELDLYEGRYLLKVTYEGKTWSEWFNAPAGQKVEYRVRMDQ